MEYNLFLSHNRLQKPWVRELYRFLRDLGFTVFFDEESISPGEDFVLAIERAVEASTTLLLVLSRSSIASKWVAFEIALRIAEDPLNEGKRLIPIFVEPIDPKRLRPSLRRLDRVDLSDATSREREFLSLLRSLGVPEPHRRCITSWPQPTGIEPVSEADINSVLAAGWDSHELLRRLISLDYSLFEGLEPRYEGDVDQWAPVFFDHPDTWRLLVTADREIVGYWHFAPLFPEDYNRACRGLLLDSEITADRVQAFELPGVYDVYFVSFGLLPEYRRGNAFAAMFASLEKVLFDLAMNDIYIGRVCANAFTLGGRSLCRSLGMRQIASHSSHGHIYEASAKELLRSTPLLSRADLTQRYETADARLSLPST